MNLKPWNILSSDGLDTAALSEPLRARKSWRYRIVGDLFFTLGAEDIAAIFGVMAASSRHTFEIATESPHMMREWFKWIVEHDTSCDPWTNCHWFALMTDENDDGPVHRLSGDDAGSPRPWPLSNLRLTTHVTTQAEADARIPALLACPAASYGLTMTPTEGIDIADFLVSMTGDCGCSSCEEGSTCGKGREVTPRLDVVTVQGAADPVHPDWVRSIRDQCKAAGVPFRFEGWGEWAPCFSGCLAVASVAAHIRHTHVFTDGRTAWRVGGRRSGRLLDGVTHDGEVT